MFKSALLIGTVAIALGFVAAPTFAQNPSASPAFGNTTLNSGFTPDPYNVQLTAGGSIDASQSVGSNCRGFVADAPDFDLYYNAGSSYPLIISVSSGADTTLVIKGPDGRWYCDDDGGSGTNPSVRFNNPQSGLYDIWVGTYGSSTASATLGISEVSSY